MRRAWAAIVAGAIASASAADDKIAEAHTAWSKVLAQYVLSHGGVNYTGLAKDSTSLQTALTAYADVDLRGASDTAKKAALINLYNAGMMHNLLRYARESQINVQTPQFLQLEINKLSVSGGNLWNSRYTVKLGGFDLTLDEIEHGLIRGASKVDDKLLGLKVNKLDPRIHVAVNCAALSCPRVRERPYTESTLDAMLDENMREFVSSETHFSKRSDRLMRANKIVSWYYEDFDTPDGAGNFLARFLSDQTKDREWKRRHFQENLNHRNSWLLKVSRAFDFYYDWRVNDERNKM